MIGAGIAGASIAAEIAAGSRVLLLERERQPGYHTTGRSAALFTETYGNEVKRALSHASKTFLQQPPAGVRADAAAWRRAERCWSRPNRRCRSCARPPTTAPASSATSRG